MTGSMKRSATYLDVRLDEILAARFAVLGIEPRSPCESHQDDIIPHMMRAPGEAMELIDAVVEDSTRDVEVLRDAFLGHEVGLCNGVVIAEVERELQIWVDEGIPEQRGVE